MVQRSFFEASSDRYHALCTYECLYGEAAHGQVVRTIIHSFSREDVSEEPAEVHWDEVSEDGYLADLNIAQPLRYDPFPSIQEDYQDRIKDLLSEVDLEDSVMGGVQKFTMSCLALHAMQEYGVTMQVEEDKARIAHPRGWPGSKDDLHPLKKNIELRIFRISEEQQRLEHKDR